MTDFGNFQFGIEVEDRFSSSTTKFRTELQRSLAAFRDFRRGIAGLSKESSGLRDNFRQVQSDARATASSFKRISENLKRVAQDSAAGNKERQQSINLLKQEATATAQLSVQLRNQVALLRQRNAELRAFNQLSGRAGRNPRATPLIDPGDEQRGRRLGGVVDSLRRQLRGAAQEGQKLQIPLGRVLATVFAISAVRRFSGAFKEIVSDAIKFNQTIETSRLGIAALLTAVGQVQSQFGGAVSAGQALAEAGKEADKQIALLQQDALNTVATFEQLLDTFQIAIAPGLTAGLDLDQVRQFTVQISQAAAALGVAQNQLSEEIRSILSGTIQARTTRIATALGITNEDIRRAREAGVLVEFLNDRFSAFSTAGREALNTFEGLRGRIQDVLTRVTGLASTPLFDNLKAALKDIFDLLSNVDEFGVLRPDPEVVAIFEAIFNALSNIVTTARNVIRTLDLSSLKDSALAFAAALETIGNVVIGLFQGITRATRSIAAFFSPIIEAIAGLTGQVGPVNELVANFTEFAAVLGTIVITITSLSALVTPIGALVAVIGLALNELKSFLSETFDVNATWTDVARLIGIGVVTSVKILTNLVENGFRLAVLGVQAAFLGVFQVVDGVIGNITQFIALAGSFIPGIGDSFGEAADKIAQVRQELNAAFNPDTLRKTVADIQKGNQDISAAFQESEQAFTKFFTELATRDLSGAAKDALPNPQAVQTLSARLGALPPRISTVRNALNDVNEALGELDKTGREAARALDFSRAVGAVSGVASEIAKAINDAQAASDETSRNAVSRQIQVRSQLEQVQRREITNLEKISALNTDQQTTLANLLGAQRTLALEEEDAARLRTQVAAKEDQVRTAAERGEIDKARALQVEQAQLQSLLNADEQRITAQKQIIDLIGQTADPSVVQAFLERVAIEAQQNQLLNDQKVLQETINQLQQRNLEIANQRAEAASIGENARLQQTLPLLAAEQAAQLNIVDALNQRGVAGAQELAEAQNRTAQAQLELDILRQQRDEEIALLEAQIAKQVAAGLDVAEQQKLLAALRTQRDLEVGAGEAALVQLQRIQERARLVKEGSIVEGLTAGLNDVAERIGSEFQAGIDIATGIVNSFASFVSNSLVDAFDPTKEFDLREAFARFLQDIARLVIQKLTEIAVAKAILGLGLQQGGAVPAGNPSAQPSLAHYANPIGFAAGGGIRPPKGVDKRDTVPIWAQPGEFVMKLDAVRKYGAGFMHALNQGALDPGALRGMVSRRVTGQRTRRVPGFAAGGLISDALSSATQQATRETRRAQTATSSPSGGDRTVAAVMVPNDETLDRMLQGGDLAMVRWLRENKSTINSTLGNNGGR